ncbi:hypothetical protein Gotri_026695 [Gossypium trilobum]|uniref:Uncharacterized protein n=1 Tax=Gossypium trilobum TaxID=34281 RepID=A0A7J9FGI9_9ROSI|nr:hypothetical protein [Gossypium trilobum]
MRSEISMSRLPCSISNFFYNWLSKNIGKKVDKSALSNGSAMTDKSTSAPSGVPTASLKVLRPDTSQMVIYDPRQLHGEVIWLILGFVLLDGL